MRSTMIALAATATIAGLAIIAPRMANATCPGCDGPPGAPPAPVGAPVGGGAAYPYGAYYGYGPSNYYAPAQRYYGPAPGCNGHNQRVWDGYAWQVQRVQSCY
jgi:hypothetical protein